MTFAPSLAEETASDLTSSLSCLIYFTICSTMAYSPYELLPQFVSLDFFVCFVFNSVASS